MSGILGIVSPSINVERAAKSLNLISHRGEDEEGTYSGKGIFLGHKRLIILDGENGKQPYIFNNWIMVYNGKVYNIESLREELISKGYSFNGYSDVEVLIKLFAEYKEDCVKKLNGIFAFVIWNRKTKQLFACRDRVGAKPLYYYYKNNQFMFSSEIKSILDYYSINTIGLEGLQEMLGLGPSHTSGSGIYPNIFELKAGHYFYYENEKVQEKRYWNVEAFEHNSSFEQTVEETRNLVEDSIKNQLVSDKPLCTFLSGGLDSTAITLIAKQYKPDLETCSIEYLNNDKYFTKNDFQVSSDNEFVKLVVDKFNLVNHKTILETQELIEGLKDALILKDYPGMVDVDSSFLAASRQIKNKFTVALSGECADEIFGGYPWFYREEYVGSFPWIRNLEERSALLNKKYRKKLKLKEFVRSRYQDTISEVPLTGEEGKTERQHKELVYVNMLWFMQTLLDRTDRMTMGAGLEVRVPFADHRLIEYLYNIPWRYKFYNNMEKGLLRMAVKDIVPEEILFRKKNPYPKTHNPEYLEGVKRLLNESLADKNSILHELFDKKELSKILAGERKKQKPWFGQLMTYPQLIAYLYQFDLWFKLYNLNIVE